MNTKARLNSPHAALLCNRHDNHSHNNNDPRAFSLLELVLIIAIIAIVAAIAVPRYGNSLARYHAEVTARRVVADLGLAQAMARTTTSAVTVTFEVPNNRYELQGVVDADHPGQNASLTLADPPYYAQLVAAVFGGDKVVIFDGYGMPDSGGSIDITAGGVTKTIQLDPDTGKAVVQ